MCTVVSENETRDIQVVTCIASAELVFSEIGLTTAILPDADPTGDDSGLGTYIYPRVSVFDSKAFLQVAFDVVEDNAILTFRNVRSIDVSSLKDSSVLSSDIESLPVCCLAEGRIVLPETTVC